MPVHVQTVDGIPLVQLDGEIDLYNCEKIFASVREKIEGNDVFVLSLANCGYCDSSCIHEIVKLSKTKRVVVVATDQVRRIFDIANLDRLVPVVSSVDAAIKRIK